VVNLLRNYLVIFNRDGWSFSTAKRWSISPFSPTKKHFFERLRQEPEGFVFPLLNYESFRDHLNDLSHLDKDLSYQIHRATTRYNSNLNVICKSLKLSKKLTSHSPRHSIALHLMEQGATTPVIQDVLGQRNLTSTAVYLQQRLPSNNINAGMDLIHGN
jgi:integrase